MLSKFFLDRPVFAWVIAIILLSLGGLAIYSMALSAKVRLRARSDASGLERAMPMLHPIP